MSVTVKHPSAQTLKDREVLISYHGKNAVGMEIFIIEFIGKDCQSFGRWPVSFVQLGVMAEAWILLGKRPN